MLTPSDIRNPKRPSGFKNVTSNAGSAVRPFQARAGWKMVNGSGIPDWIGPRRATADEAAQDYCDHMNGRGITPRAVLKSAGHATKRPSRPKAPQDPLLVEAAEHDRKAREARAKYEAQHPEGYVYLVGEEVRPGTHPVLRFAVKIGKSANLPQYRLGGLQTGNPRKLVLLGYIWTPDRHKTETELHAKFAHLNILQEWFRPNYALLSEFNVVTPDGRIPSERQAA